MKQVKYHLQLRFQPQNQLHHDNLSLVVEIPNINPIKIDCNLINQMLYQNKCPYLMVKA